MLILQKIPWILSAHSEPPHLSPFSGFYAARWQFPFLAQDQYYPFTFNWLIDI